jgi:hypothetical protein
MNSYLFNYLSKYRPEYLHFFTNYKEIQKTERILKVKKRVRIHDMVLTFNGKISSRLIEDC